MSDKSLYEPLNATDFRSLNHFEILPSEMDNFSPVVRFVRLAAAVIVLVTLLASPVLSSLSATLFHAVIRADVIPSSTNLFEWECFFKLASVQFLFSVTVVCISSFSVCVSNSVWFAFLPMASFNAVSTSLCSAMASATSLSVSMVSGAPLISSAILSSV